MCCCHLFLLLLFYFFIKKKKHGVQLDMQCMEFYHELFDAMFHHIQNIPTETIVLSKKLSHSIVKWFHTNNSSEWNPLFEDDNILHLLATQKVCTEPTKEASVNGNKLQKMTLLLTDYFTTVGNTAKRLIKRSYIIFWNRFIDIYDAIQDSNNWTDIDNSDFLHSDIPPPEKLYVCKDKGMLRMSYTDAYVESIREWVLESIVTQEQPVLDTKPCAQCQTQIFEATLQCPHCTYCYEQCAVSGYPLSPKSMVKQSVIECRNCHCKAEKESWNVFVIEKLVKFFFISSQKIEHKKRYLDNFLSTAAKKVNNFKITTCADMKKMGFMEKSIIFMEWHFLQSTHV
ncbi:hypothetical protein RFI_27117 [Reticulomyxa filosa]|uniref:Uncharacterized protein n=1 Tax=Reticulomyxa filosa TaxID=46433 RepID=X6M8L8_RETFI|nr:hypothetical protein RFI_27117 [Reticulomyxa filosa]|eukprot:ETO10259.1 hypothetical protein RFI_27117 [Reticulomyxa filosa]